MDNLCESFFQFQSSGSTIVMIYSNKNHLCYNLQKCQFIKIIYKEYTCSLSASSISVVACGDSKNSNNFADSSSWKHVLFSNLI